MGVTFEKRKKDFLAKSDKSSIGSWDKPIIRLCNKINKKQDYFTLSSCSGRIVLIKGIKEKEHGIFLFRTHKKVTLAELHRELKKIRYKGVVIFKQEPGILHIACRDINKAYVLLKKAQEAGWKHSGIIAISSNRIVVELIGSEQLALPIMNKNKVLVGDNFLKILVKESNNRLESTWKRIEKLEKIL